MTHACSLTCKPENVLKLFRKWNNIWSGRGGVGRKGNCLLKLGRVLSLWFPPWLVSIFLPVLCLDSGFPLTLFCSNFNSETIGKLEAGRVPLVEKLVHLITFPYCVYLNRKGCQWSVNDRQGEWEIPADGGGLYCVSCLKRLDILSWSCKIGSSPPWAPWLLAVLHPLWKTTGGQLTHSHSLQVPTYFHCYLLHDGISNPPPQCPGYQTYCTHLSHGSPHGTVTLFLCLSPPTSLKASWERAHDILVLVSLGLAWLQCTAVT